MSSPAASPPSSPALTLLAETAARALPCVAHVVPDAAGQLTLQLAPPGDGPPWTEAERALAASFVALAPAAATADRAAPLQARLTELERHVDRLEHGVAERTAALRSSEEWFRRMIEHGHDLIVVMDADGVTRYGSPSVRRILGYDPEAYANTSLVTFFHPDDADRVVAWLAGLADRPGETHRIEFRFRHAEGHWVDLEAVSSTRADHPAGTPHVLNVRDVTERRAAERALQDREEHFRRLIENGSDLLVISAVDGPLTYVSPSAERLLGYAPSEMLAKVPDDLVHADDVPHVLTMLRTIGDAPGTIHPVHFRMRHRDGSWRWFEALARTLAPDSADAGIVCNARDTTEQRAAEQRLRETEERYRTVVETLNEVVFHSDAQGRWTFLNRAWSEITGLSVADSLGRSFLEFAHPEDLSRCQQSYAMLLSGQHELVRHDVRFRHADGGWRDIDVLVRAVRDAAGAIVGTTGTLNDVTEQRAADRALRASEEHFRTLIENAHDVIVVIEGPTGHVLYQSPAMERILGYAPEALAGRNAFALVHPDDLADTQREIARALAEPGTTRHAEYRYRHRDGSWRDLETFGRTLSTAPGERRLVFNTRDVTERREAERALQRSEEHFRRLIEHSYDLVQVIAADGRIAYTGPSVQRLLGYTPEEIAGMTIPDFMHADDLPAAGELVARLLANPGVSGSLEYRVRHKDGTYRWLEAYATTLSPTSAEHGLVANARDVTDRKRSELALQQSEDHFRRLIENGSDLLMISAPDGRLSYVSPSTQRLFGYPPEEVLAWTPQQVIHPDDIAPVLASMAEIATQPGTVHRVHWRVRHRDGGWRTIEALARTLSPDSPDAGIVINGRDVTEQRAAETALRRATGEAEQARAEAERANRAKSEFLSRMSHELRTPLNSILGFAQVLEALELPTEYRGSVRHILNGGRHLLDLINEVLDIARIEADEQPLSIEPVRVHAVLREAMDMVSPLAAARGVQLCEVPHASADRHVRADRQRLTQVLLNLLSNAVKYNRAHGTVRIGCEAVRDTAGEERLRIRVADEGHGIPAEQHGQLFVPFARLGAEHTGVEGTGLGLALSQRLARAMGGALSLERSGSDGSVFAVDLQPAANPLAALPIVAARGDGGAPDAHGAATLLYIEDNLANLTLVETILLPRAAWRLVPALQGRLGLELAAEHAPDVILLDLHLPDMGGRDVLRHLRAEPRTATTPVVIISADATPRTIDALLADGADAFLTKPLDVRAFLATVERLLARARRAV